MNESGGKRWKRVLKCVVLFVAVAFLSGCYELHQGLYEASKVTGWKKHESEGVTYLWHGTTAHAYFFVSRKGALSVRLATYSFWQRGIDYRFVKFLGDTIDISFHDVGGRTTVPVDDLRKEFSQTLSIGDSKDFTITLPAVKVEGEVMPQVSVHFRWFDRKYLVSIPLQ